MNNTVNGTEQNSLAEEDANATEDAQLLDFDSSNQTFVGQPSSNVN